MVSNYVVIAIFPYPSFSPPWGLYSRLSAGIGFRFRFGRLSANFCRHSYRAVRLMVYRLNLFYLYVVEAGKSSANRL